MTTSEIRALYDSMAATFTGTVRSFTVVVDDMTSYSTSGILGNAATLRHLFQGGLGQRYTANLICRTDRFTDDRSRAVSEEGLADKLTGLICTIGSTQYRVMSANPTPEGGLMRIGLDSVEQVGL